MIGVQPPMLGAALAGSQICHIRTLGIPDAQAARGPLPEFTDITYRDHHLTL